VLESCRRAGLSGSILHEIFRSLEQKRLGTEEDKAPVYTPDQQKIDGREEGRAKALSRVPAVLAQ
jgi:hypothetical protein